VRATDREFPNSLLIRWYSLFLVAEKIAALRKSLTQQGLGGIVRCSPAFLEKFPVKFADKFAVPRTPVNYFEFKRNPLFYSTSETRSIS
jgi:hypothetical protein